MLDNWIYNKKKEVMSISDKIKILLKPSNAIKLVFVQKCELEYLQKNIKNYKYFDYVNSLYNHYIINNLPKTYLCS